MAKLEELEARIERQEAINEIINLQGRFEHLLLCKEYEKIPDLFAQKTPGVRMEIADGGVWEGIDGVRRIFKHMRQGAYDFRGTMMGIMVTTPVIEVSKDGKSAKALWYGFGPATLPGTQYPGNPDQMNVPTAIWVFGKKPCDYVKEDGKWKLLSFVFLLIFRTPYDQGWIRQPVASSFTQNPDLCPPDKPPFRYMPYSIERFMSFPPLPPERGE